jgi:hypothetical protein
MPSALKSQSVYDLVSFAKREFPAWIVKQNEVAIPRSIRVLSAFNEGDTSKILSIGRYHSYLSYFNLKKLIADSVSGRTVDAGTLALAVDIETREFFYAVGVLEKNTNCGISISEYADALAKLITVGWKDMAELYARHGFAQLQLVGIRRGDIRGGALMQGQSLFRYPYFLMDLIKDWLQANVSTETPFRQEVIGDLGGWQDLLSNWRDPDAERFAQVLSHAADYHVEQSRDMVEKGHNEDPQYQLDHFEIEKDAYWLFPILLLSVLRLREWEGLNNPRLDHPLFQSSPIAQLPAGLQRPDEGFYNSVDQRFRSLFPRTPSLADLPELRAAQAR